MVGERSNRGKNSLHHLRFLFTFLVVNYFFGSLLSPVDDNSISLYFLETFKLPMKRVVESWMYLFV